MDRRADWVIYLALVGATSVAVWLATGNPLAAGIAAMGATLTATHVSAAYEYRLRAADNTQAEEGQ